MRLIVSEKNSVAKKLAEILSNGSAKNVGEKKTPIYSFKDNGSETKVLPLRGHILEVDFPPEYKSWKEPPPKALLDAEIIKSPHEKGLVATLRKLAKEADDIVIATDYDREGELIGLDVRTIAEKANPSASFSRARFSALTPTEINHAFSSLDTLDENLAHAGEARQDIDLVWGAALTRHLSLITNRLWRNFLSAGRVQSPTLALIVNREKEIRAFVPEDYWQVKIICDKNGSQFPAYHKTDRFSDEASAKAVFDKIGDRGTVKDVKSKERTINPPAPFNTTTFLTACSSLKISAAKAMQIAESLYTKGYISYPRVDNTVYPPSLDLKGVLRSITRAEVVGNFATELLQKETLTSTRGKQFSTDHPPIYPTGAPNKEKINPQDWKVWELIARRFMATVADSAKARSTVVDIDVNEEPFVAKGDVILSEGFLRYYPYTRKKDETLPILEINDELAVVDKQLEAKQTQPPARYTEGSLIKKMEELGLGTKSTRHSIIQTLKSRSYISTDLEPSETGIAVCEALERHALTVTTPDMTAELEKDMDKVAEGNETLQSVTERSRQSLGRILDEMESARDSIKEEVDKALKTDRVVIAKCPDCGSDLIVRRAKKSGKRFVGCSGYPACNRSYPLPQKGMVEVTGEVCETCKAPMVKIVTKGKKPWNICLNPECPTKASEDAEVQD